MKITKILIAVVFLIAAACSSPGAENDHGHEHESEAEHTHEGTEDHMHKKEPVEQEEFTVEEDSATHTHEDGGVHHDH